MRSPTRAVPRSLAGAIIAVAIGALIVAAASPPLEAEPGAVSAATAARDLGDAPDGRPTGYASGAPTGRFPTLGASGGPSHPAGGGGLRLGALQTGERAPRQVDRDRGDDGAELLRLRACRVSTLQVLLNARGLSERDFRRLRARNAAIYVNAWLDYNRDGDWADGTDGCAPEWGVQDLRVPLRQLGADRVALLPIRFRAGRAVGELWWRVTATLGQRAGDPAGREPSGGYRAGETQDYVMRAPPRAPSARANAVFPPVAVPGFGGDTISRSVCSPDTMVHGTIKDFGVFLDGDNLAFSLQTLRALPVLGLEPDVRLRSGRRVFSSYRLFRRPDGFAVRSTQKHRREEGFLERVTVSGSVVIAAGRARSAPIPFACEIIIFHDRAERPRTARQPRTTGGDQPPDAPAPSPGPGGPAPHCSDGADNDGDGLIDAADPGCRTGPGAGHDPADTSEEHVDATSAVDCPTIPVFPAQRQVQIVLDASRSAVMMRHLLVLRALGMPLVDTDSSKPNFASGSGTLGTTLCGPGTGAAVIWTVDAGGKVVTYTIAAAKDDASVIPSRNEVVAAAGTR
jgi:hypothetical protein